MTKMAPMPIYGKNPSKIFFSETNGLISIKLGVKHRLLKYYIVYINHDHVMTLTSLWQGQYGLPMRWGKLLKYHLKGKTSRKLANGQNIDYSEKRKWHNGFIGPCTRVKNMFIGICSRSQVSVYRTIGPMVLARHHQTVQEYTFELNIKSL